MEGSNSSVSLMKMILGRQNLRPLSLDHSLSFLVSFIYTLETLLTYLLVSVHDLLMVVILETVKRTWFLLVTTKPASFISWRVKVACLSLMSHQSMAVRLIQRNIHSRLWSSKILTHHHRVFERSLITTPHQFLSASIGTYTEVNPIRSYCKMRRHIIRSNQAKASFLQKLSLIFRSCSVQCTQSLTMNMLTSSLKTSQSMLWRTHHFIWKNSSTNNSSQAVESLYQPTLEVTLSTWAYLWCTSHCEAKVLPSKYEWNHQFLCSMNKCSLVKSTDERLLWERFQMEVLLQLSEWRLRHVNHSSVLSYVNSVRSIVMALQNVTWLLKALKH